VELDTRVNTSLQQDNDLAESIISVTPQRLENFQLEPEEASTSKPLNISAHLTMSSVL